MINDNVFDFETLPQIVTEVHDISLSSLNMTNELDNKDGDKEISRSVNETFLLKSIQSLQELVIYYQNQFKTYESLSEYAKFIDVEIFIPKKWKDLQYTEIETQMQNFMESIRNLYKCSYEIVRAMDTAVVRLREDNEKINELLKLKKLNPKVAGLIVSEYPKGQTLSSMVTIDASDNLEDLIKKSRKQHSKINELRKEIVLLETNLTNAETTLENLEKENKKLKKQLRASKDETEASVLDEISKLHKEIKKLGTTFEPCDDDTKTYSRQDSVKLERKIDTLIESYDNQEKLNQKYFEKTFKEINSLKENMKQFSGRKSQDAGDSDSEDIRALRKKIKKLEEIIESKDEEISENKEIIESNEREFKQRLADIRSSQEEDVRSLDRNMNSLIGRCSQCREKVSINGDDDTEEPLHNKKEVITNNEKLEDKLRKQENLIIEKNKAMEIMRLKITQSKQLEEGLKQETAMSKERIEELESEVAKYKEELEKKTKAVATMREKIKDMNLLNSIAEEKEQINIKLKESTQELTSLKERITVCEKDLNKKNEEFEILKKTNNRLESELTNMKKLNFQKKTEKK